MQKANNHVVNSKHLKKTAHCLIFKSTAFLHSKQRNKARL